jgi:type II secretory pathway component PulK
VSSATHHCRKLSPRRDNGSVLIVAMVILFAMAAMTVVLSRSTRVEAIASANAASAIQAQAVARAAEQWVFRIVADEGDDVLRRAEGDFIQRQVGEGWFWIIRPHYGDASMPAFGIVDEASKLNVNRVSEYSLQLLPEMTQDVAAAILDWRDADDETRPGGAESMYYLSLPDPYVAKNARFESVEELLLVRGVDMERLYGTATSASGDQRFGAAFRSPALEGGWSDLLTVYSLDPGLSRDGDARVFANSRQQRDRLRDAFAARLEATRANDIVDAIGNQNLRDPFDLYFRARLTPDEFRAIEDVFRTTRSQRRRGLVNINTAPRDVLLTIRDLSVQDVETLLAQRPAAVAAHPGSVAWVAEAIGERAVGIGNRITGRAHQFSADIIAVSGDGRAFERVRIVIDTAADSPRVVYRRDITHRGWPLDPLVLEAIRHGDAPTASGARLERLF